MRSVFIIPLVATGFPAKQAVENKKRGAFMIPLDDPECWPSGLSILTIVLAWYDQMSFDFVSSCLAPSHLRDICISYIQPSGVRYCQKESPLGGPPRTASAVAPLWLRMLHLRALLPGGRCAGSRSQRVVEITVARRTSSTNTARNASPKKLHQARILNARFHHCQCITVSASVNQ